MNGMKVKDIACGLRHTILLTGKSTTHFNDARAGKSTTHFKARSHGAFFFLCVCDAENGLCGCQ